MNALILSQLICASHLTVAYSTGILQHKQINLDLYKR
jgi:hypothetical protein